MNAGSWVNTCREASFAFTMSWLRAKSHKAEETKAEEPLPLAELPDNGLEIESRLYNGAAHAWLNSPVALLGVGRGQVLRVVRTIQ